MPKAIKDISNKKFGRLTAKMATPKRDKKGEVIWECICDCGNICEVSIHHLRAGNIQSCGCLKKESASRNSRSDVVENTKLSQLNTKIFKNNTSGIRGVSRCGNKWRAEIEIKKKRIFLGIYENIEDAAKARKQAEKEHFESVLNKYGRELK